MFNERNYTSHSYIYHADTCLLYYVPCVMRPTQRGIPFLCIYGVVDPKSTKKHKYPQVIVYRTRTYLRKEYTTVLSTGKCPVRLCTCSVRM